MPYNPAEKKEKRSTKTNLIKNNFERNQPKKIEIINNKKLVEGNFERYLPKQTWFKAL